MSLRNIVIPTRINKTATEWAADSTVYSSNKILVVTNQFYGNGHVMFKYANGINTYAALPFAPEGTPDTNMANDNLILDDDREHDAAGNSWSLTDLRNLRFESTSTGSGVPAFNFEFNSGSASFSDIVTRIAIDGNTTTPAFEMRGNKNAAFGDAALSNVRLNVYYSVNGGIGMRVYTDQPNQRALQFQSDGAGSTGIFGLANGTNGVAMELGGQLLGAIIKALDASGNGARILGGALIANYNDAGAQNDASLLHLRTSDLAALLIDPITKAQRDSIATFNGMIVAMSYYDDDNPEGLYFYHSTLGWVRFMFDV